MIKPLFWLLALFTLVVHAASAATTYHPSAVHVWFSPDGGCTEAIVDALKSAKKTVRVQAFLFTSPHIATALIEARKRGLDVAVILDGSQRSENRSSDDLMKAAGVPVFVDAVHNIAHNKIIIIDGETVFTGSFNFTKAAETHNAENLLRLDDPALAARYLSNWNDHKAHSEAYKGTDK